MQILLNKTSNDESCNWQINLSRNADTGSFQFNIFFQLNHVTLIDVSNDSQELEKTRGALRHWLSGTPVNAPLSKEFREALVDFLYQISA